MYVLVNLLQREPYCTLIKQSTKYCILYMIITLKLIATLKTFIISVGEDISHLSEKRYWISFSTSKHSDIYSSNIPRFLEHPIHCLYSLYR